MEEVLAWMNANPNLSGWAQTVGALFALLIALWVPWMQHTAQSRRTKLVELENNIYLSQATMLLLRDAQNLNERVRQLADLPRLEIYDPVLVTDLLERLRTLDAKDNSIPRQASQYIARAAVLRVNYYLDSGQAQFRELSPPVLKLLEDDCLHMENEFRKLNFLLQDFLYQQTKQQVAIWKRPFVWYGFKTKAGRKWLEASSEQQLQRLKKQQGIQQPRD